MTHDTTPDVRLTYAQLDEVLRRLGYVREAGADHVAFFDPRTQTRLLYPLTSPADVVPFHHLQMAWVNSTWRGVVDEAGFAGAIRDVAGGGPSARAA